MCGLVAMLSKRQFGFNQNEVDSFSQMLFVNQLRGKDGTGIFYNSKKDNFNNLALKAAVPSSVFVEQTEFDNAISTVFKESKYIVGHNRAGTKGGVEVKNTHPFREKHITLVHNGTLYKHDYLHPTYESDSKAICYAFAEKGAIETLKEIDGAFALIWSNAKEKTINFCRNAQRPLYMIETDNSYFFSSEEGLVKWVLSRNNIIIKESKMMDTHTLYTFPFEDFTKFTETKVEFYKYVYLTTTVYNNSLTRKERKRNKAISMGFLSDKDEEGEFSTEWPWNPDGSPIGERKNPLQIENKSSSTFAFGQEIRFRAGVWIKDKHASYLQGDILIDQKTPANITLIPNDFEDLFRIKIYGNFDDLSKFVFKRNLVGKVVTTTFNNGNQTRYTVSQVKEFGVEKETKSSEQDCDFCNKSFPLDMLTNIHDCDLCPACAVSMVQYS